MFPLEIVEEIIDWVDCSHKPPRTGTETLLICARVSRTWLARARWHTFGVTAITGASDVNALALLIAHPLCTFRSSVRVLRVVNAPRLPYELALLHRVQILDIQDTVFEAGACVYRPGPALKSLVLRRVELEGTIMEEILVKCRDLKRLALDGCPWTSESAPHSLTMPTTLESLAVAFPWEGGLSILRSLIQGSTTISISSITLQHIRAAHFKDTFKLLRAIGPSLAFVYLDFYPLWPYEQDLLLCHMDLSSLSNLHMLEIGYYSAFGAMYARHIPAVLAQFTMESLKEIRVGASCDMSSTTSTYIPLREWDWDWTILARVLNNTEQTKTLSVCGIRDGDNCGWLDSVFLDLLQANVDVVLLPQNLTPWSVE